MPTDVTTAAGPPILLLHYGELSLKGKNRHLFESRLIGNMKRLAGEFFEGRPERPRGRVMWKLRHSEEEPADVAEVCKRVGRIYGIANFSIARAHPLELEAMTEAAIELAAAQIAELAPASPEDVSFAIRARRGEKKFPMKSPEVCRHVGAAVQSATGARVDLGDPDVLVCLELLEDRVLVYPNAHQGAGGLPVGIEGQVTVLLSGGIDSPVAAAQMMKRGCWVHYVHFHSAPFTDIASQEKALELARVLTRRQGGAKVDMVPFVGVQQEIIAHCPAELRVLLYRRFMMRIATKLARQHSSLALVTGESLGQVASQTLHNLAAIEAATDLPILRPLIAFDKQEIIAVARQLETYDLSIQPHDDCCSFMMPSSVATSATPAVLERAERDLDIEALVEMALDGVTTEILRAED